MRAVPWLVADIGGTNMRLGRILKAGAPVQDVVRIDTPRVGDIAPALKPYLDGFIDGRPHAAALAMAGPIVNGNVQLTNSGAHLSAATAERQLGLDKVVLINDLEAVAAALPRLSGTDARILGQDPADGVHCPTPTRATRVVLGCGTGCGVGAVVWAGDHWHVFASEGGHLPFPAFTNRDVRWRDHVAARLAQEARRRVTVDRMLCGSGFKALGDVIAIELGCAPLATPEEIAAVARVGGNPLAAIAAAHFAEAVGNFAGDLAQVFLARGGVYLAGSLLEGLETYLSAPPVRAAFTRKWPHDLMLATYPLRLIVDPRAPLAGLGEILARL